MKHESGFIGWWHWKPYFRGNGKLHFRLNIIIEKKARRIPAGKD